MPVNDLYILPEDVQLIPVKEIAEPSRSKFEYKEDDFVITYSNARNTSKIIDAASAMLLREFKKPASMIEGIFKYSYLNKLDPQDILEETYGFLSRLRSEGFLVLYDDTTSTGNKDLLRPSSLFKDYEVVEKIQGISDTEVYQLKKDNLFFALKILKTEGKLSPLTDQFYNELTILEHIKGSYISPAIVESGALDNNLYMILEYCKGTSCDVSTEKYRNLGDTENLSHLLTIAVNILAAYETLHRYTVIHSDIHPRNILVDESGSVKIIDFGLAQLAGSENRALRGGISFFYEPEYAYAVSHEQPAPASSYAGEQYALAALIYFLLTGKQYLNFSYEKNVLLRQILNEPPIPFLKHDIDIDAEIESVIFKALSRQPADRYPSVGEFKKRLLHCKERLDNTTMEVKYSFTAFCDTLKKRFGYDGPFIENGLQLAPTCSVNYGAAGIAYMFYRMAVIEADAELLTLADVWINRAYDYLKKGGAAFYATDIEITPATVGDVSVYHSPSGVHLVQALISKAMGDDANYQRSVINFIADASRACKDLDLTVGKSSLLIGCSLLYESLTNEHAMLTKELQQFGNKVMSEIWNTIDTYSPITSNSPIIYRGIAHGWAGILYATLRWCQQNKTALPDHYIQRAEQLVNIGIEEDNYMRWGLTNDNSVSWPGWCHGSAGYIFLWSELYKFTDNEKYLTTAEKTANHFLTTENLTNSSLCCGLAGECYALLNLYNTTKNDFYLDETKKLAKTVLQNAYSSEAKNNSLYKGDVGIAVLFTELRQPQYARMPVFE